MQSRSSAIKISKLIKSEEFIEKSHPIQRKHRKPELNNQLHDQSIEGILMWKSL